MSSSSSPERWGQQSRLLTPGLPTRRTLKLRHPQDTHHVLALHDPEPLQPSTNANHAPCPLFAPAVVLVAFEVEVGRSTPRFSRRLDERCNGFETRDMNLVPQHKLSGLAPSTTNQCRRAKIGVGVAGQVVRAVRQVSGVGRRVAQGADDVVEDLWRERVDGRHGRVEPAAAVDQSVSRLSLTRCDYKLTSGAVSST